MTDITMRPMRTTLTIDEDVAHELTERQRRTGESFKQLVNATLRAGLQAGRQPAEPPAPFRVDAKAAGFRAGVDVRRLNQLNDELETEAFQQKLSRSVADR